jgi:hypothetical protein
VSGKSRRPNEIDEATYIGPAYSAEMTLAACRTNISSETVLSDSRQAYMTQCLPLAQPREPKRGSRSVISHHNNRGRGGTHRVVFRLRLIKLETELR